MNDLGVGIVGYGWAAGAHIAAINACPGARVVAVCSSRGLDRAEVEAAHGGPVAVYRELEELLADASVDVVSVCSLPGLHAGQAVAAAGAGKHLIIEKPLALTLEDCRRVEAAVAEAGVRACVCFECRYSSQLLATKAVLDQGLIGEVHYGEVDYYHGIGPWYGQFRWNTTLEHGGSSLLSAGCHALDALLLCMGTEVEEVTGAATGSRAEVFSSYDYPTTSVTIVRFADGRVGKVTSCIDCLQPYYFHTHLVGSAGSLLDNRFHSARLGGLNKARWSELSLKLLDSGDVSDHPYEMQFAVFFDAVREGREMPLTSLGEAVKTFEVLFAADQSAREGRPVRLERAK